MRAGLTTSSKRRSARSRQRSSTLAAKRWWPAGGWASTEIVALIGAGGMGEVYRARDTKLGRDVAIKVIARAAPADADQMARFEREARILAALNHPHIGAIYGLEDVDGIRALVLELVEGKTLAERLTETRPSMPATLTIARDIAAALEAAHEKGVIHRDLKPANIKITPNGAVKVLDFGLAKVFASDDPAAGSTRSPGLTFEEREGVIAGTAGYMSPEQARGTAVNKRADIWAFGCVLYEMLAGRPAFSGETRADIMAWILERDPDWSALPATTPATIERLLRRCLERDATRRLRDIGDARLEIEGALSDASSPGAEQRRTAAPAPAPVARKRRTTLWWAAAAAAIVVGGLAAANSYLQRPDQPERPADLWRDPFEGATFRPLTDFGGAAQHAAISRDGQFVVFISDRETRGVWDAWAGPISSTSDFINLTRGSLEELRNPATRTLGFNLDGSRVVLWSRTKDPTTKQGLVNGGWVVPTNGSQPPGAYLQMEARISELDYCRDGRMVYHTPPDGDPLFVQSTKDDKGTQIFEDKAGVHNHFPLWSPDCAFIYFVHGPLEKGDVWRIRPSPGSAPERITTHDSTVRFPAFLDNRTLVYLATDHDGNGPWIYAMDVERRVAHRISRGLAEYTSLAASADGSRLVVTESRTTSQVWRLPISDATRDESAAESMSLPTNYGVSPQGGPGFITYRAPRAGLDKILKVSSSGAPSVVWDGTRGRAVSGAVVSRDGKRLALVVRREGRLHLFVVNADGSGQQRINGDYEVRGAPAWHPNGRWVAAGASLDGKDYLIKFPADVGGGSPVQLVNAYGTDPVWSPSGKVLFYTDQDSGTNFDVLAVNDDGTPHEIPPLSLTRGARRLAFRGENELVFMRGNVSCRNFTLLDLRNWREHQLSNLGCASEVQDFGISADGRAIYFDRWKEESAVLLIERPVK